MRLWLRHGLSRTSPDSTGMWARRGAGERFHAVRRHRACGDLVLAGWNQSSAGTDKVNSIVNCHLSTGRIGRAGWFRSRSPASPMQGIGSRSGRSRHAARRPPLDSTKRHIVPTWQRFWNSPRIAERAGYKAVELFDHRRGEVRAVWIIATNPWEPARRGPRAARHASAAHGDRVRLRGGQMTRCLMRTSACACAWGEKMARSRTPTGMFRASGRSWKRRARRSRTVDHCEVAKRMGFASCFRFNDPAAIFAEFARLTALPRDPGCSLTSRTWPAGSRAIRHDAPTQWRRRPTRGLRHGPIPHTMAGHAS